MSVDSTAEAIGAIGVVIVTFNSADVILDCLEGLLASRGGLPRIVVVDNASTDDTVAAIRAWAAGSVPHETPTDIPFALPPRPKPVHLVELRPGDRPDATALGEVTLIQSGANRGFAGGVNLGLALLAALPGIAHFWVLNPDAVTAPETPGILARTASLHPGYGMIGGRVCFAFAPHAVQIDGGTVNRWTGVTGNLNLGVPTAEAKPPEGRDMDFVTGASMLVSRAFLDRVGPMREDYFLYYEEVDWAFRRGDLPLVYAPGAVVYHRAGTSIGSPTLERLASPFSIWFKYRGRMRFVRRFNPVALPVAWAYALAKAGQMGLKGAWPQMWSILRAINGLPAPRAVRERLSPEAARLAFGPAG